MQAQETKSLLAFYSQVASHKYNPRSSSDNGKESPISDGMCTPW